MPFNLHAQAPRLSKLALSVICGAAIFMGGCSSFGNKLANNFSQSVLNNNDPATVEAGLPSYLLLLDTLVLTDPESIALRQAAATLNSSYASIFVKDPVRAKALSQKALDHAFVALCQEIEKLCEPRGQSLDAFKTILNQQDEDEIALLFTAGSAWATWIQTHSDDFNAIADLSRVQALMERVVAIDPKYQDGAGYLYLGVLSTVLTPALGGRFDEGKAYFDQSIALSNGKNLLAKVYYAKQYARGLMDRELHDQLLNEVVEADPSAQGWTLSNILAQKEAQELLASADDYF